MTVRVLIVDDSAFIRHQIARILTLKNDIEVIGQACNGREAVGMVSDLRPDVVTMDVQMPVMDGISAVRQIMRETPVPIMMISVATGEGTQATLDALDAGAMDFLPKQLEDLSSDRDQASRLMRARIRSLAKQASPMLRAYSAGPDFVELEVPEPGGGALPSMIRKNCSLMVIAASTGGPVALKKIFQKIPADFPMPVLLVQHMPGNFTPGFAERLDQGSKIDVRQAQTGDRLLPGCALLAPGGAQLELYLEHGEPRVRIRESKADEHHHPCADVTLDSIAEFFPERVFAIVLTGMGSDGKEGVSRLKQKGATIWAQNERSCVVYGMPRAVIEAGLADRVLGIDQLATDISRI